jgi:hypothetical protein
VEKPVLGLEFGVWGSFPAQKSKQEGRKRLLFALKLQTPNPKPQTSPIFATSNDPRPHEPEIPVSPPFC